MTTRSKFMKILMINQSTEMYGSDRSLLGMIEYFLKNSNHNIHLLIPNIPGPLIKELNILSKSYPNQFDYSYAPNIKISRSVITMSGLLPFTFSFIQAATFIYKNKDWLKNFDVVHTNSISVLLGSMISKVFSKKHIWNVREIIEQPRVLSWSFKVMVDLFSDKVISNSKQTHEWISAKTNNIEKYSYINNGVESLLSKASSKLSTNAEELILNNPDAIVISLVGRISSWKGQEMTLHILFSLIFNHKKKAILFFIGDAHIDSKEFQHTINELISELNLNSYVFITGFIDDIANYYLRSDFIIVPSQKPEPFGRVAIEAMSCSKVVIASKHGGLTSIINDKVNGFLVDHKDKDSFVNVIKELIDDPSLKSKVESQARQTYLQYFTAEKCFESYLKQYNKLDDK
jgi:glycosyltransferase involved in cell wall biosynthesis